MDTLQVNYNNKPCYEIVFDTSFDELSNKISELGFEKRKIAIITDSNVEGFYAETLKKELSKITENIIVYSIPAGEENKNLKEIEKIYEKLIENHFD